MPASSAPFHSRSHTLGECAKCHSARLRVGHTTCTWTICATFGRFASQCSARSAAKWMNVRTSWVCMWQYYGTLHMLDDKSSQFGNNIFANVQCVEKHSRDIQKHIWMNAAATADEMRTLLIELVYLSVSTHEFRLRRYEKCIATFSVICVARTEWAMGCMRGCPCAAKMDTLHVVER